MDKVWRKGLWIFGMAMSFLCYSTIDVSARNEVTMLVCGDTKMESREAFNTLYRDLMGRSGLTLTKRGGGDYCIGIRSSVEMDNVSADLSANLNMYYVDDLETIPKLLIPSALLVLVYAGKETEGLGNLPLLEEKLKSRKHRIDLPDMALIRLDEVLASSCDEEQGVRGCALKLVKACGKLWPRWTIKGENSKSNASGDIDPSDDSCGGDLRRSKCCYCF